MHSRLNQRFDFVGLLFAENLAPHVIINFQIGVAFHIKSRTHHQFIKSAHFRLFKVRLVLGEQGAVIFKREVSMSVQIGVSLVLQGRASKFEN